MSLYVLLFLLFLVQEPISTDAVLLEAYQYHYNIWVIHALYVVATLLDITVGYWIGAWMHRRFSQKEWAQKLVRKARIFTGAAGKYGEYVFFFLGGPILFPLSTVVAPWLDFSFAKTLFFLFLGDLVFWYGSEWLVVLGVKSVIPDPLGALFGVVFISLLIALALRYFQRE